MCLLVDHASLNYKHLLRKCMWGVEKLALLRIAIVGKQSIGYCYVTTAYISSNYVGICSDELNAGARFTENLGVTTAN